MNIAIVNDNEYDAQCCVNDAREAFPDAGILSFDSLFKAHECQINIDIAIIDLSAVAPIGIGVANHHYSAICTFLDRRPGVTVIITSAVSKNLTEDVKLDVLELMPEAQIHIVDWPWHMKLKDILRTFA